jgi:hypothetical protein
MKPLLARTEGKKSDSIRAFFGGNCRRMAESSFGQIGGEKRPLD